MKASLNTSVPFQSSEERKEKASEYRQDNKESLRAQKMEYREIKREQIKAKNMEYRVKNKALIKEKATVLINCDCGRTITKDKKARHNETKIHQSYLSTLI